MIVFLTLLPLLFVSSMKGSSGFAMDASSSTTVIPSESTTQQSNNAPLLLPAANPDDTNIPRIRLGETIRFEDMGPIILNADGTTRRISNWDQLSEQEQQVSWRRIRKRNEERRQVLLKQQQQQDGDKVVEDGNEL